MWVRETRRYSQTEMLKHSFEGCWCIENSNVLRDIPIEWAKPVRKIFTWAFWNAQFLFKKAVRFQFILHSQCPLFHAQRRIALNRVRIKMLAQRKKNMRFRWDICERGSLKSQIKLILICIFNLTRNIVFFTEQPFHFGFFHLRHITFD